jgi:hypothetical protein
MWNDEDLSIYSQDQQVDPANIHSGGRALQAIVRPYLRSISGAPINQSFDYKRKEYTLIFSDQSMGEAVIFIPNYQYPRGFRVEYTEGKWEMDEEKQELCIHYDGDLNHQIVRILPK